MMVSSTPCCTSRCLERLWRHWLRWCCCALLGFGGWWPSVYAVSAESTATPPELQLQRADDGLYLSAQLALTLPDLVEDALYKGIPMYFVAEAQVLRDRWYWSSRQVTEATRYMRLSYQPLTRRWRLNLSSTPFGSSGLGVALGQNFEEYSDVLVALQRITRWKIAEPGDIDAETEHTVQFRFRLDMSQLPRPLQIGAVGRSGWTLLVSRSLRLPAETAK